ncbi:MAG TPA: RNA polymerase sigma factor [Solirubrobacterales bacterium]|nr:RNA polymerase sigma factor [Solirubrobacterales bacterium]
MHRGGGDGWQLTAARPRRRREGRPARSRLRRAWSGGWSARRSAGTAEAVAALYSAHWPRAHRAAYLVLHDAAAAEDVAQEAFLAAVDALDRFDRRRPFGPWLHRIVLNRAIDWARRESLRRKVAEPEDLPEAEPAAAAAQVGEELMGALAQLPYEQRAVVVLRYLLDYAPGEIAAMLELPRGTVNSRLRRALDRLGAALEAER